MKCPPCNGDCNQGRSCTRNINTPSNRKIYILIGALLTVFWISVGIIVGWLMA